MRPIPESELIINPDGTIYHLQLKPGQIADTVITVGDPGRVPEVSRHFDSIEHSIKHREFLIHTGMLGTKRLTVLSTGMGTENIDIVVNELDALFNIDFETRLPREEIRTLDIIRLGTAGAVSEEIALDSLVVSEAAIGLDNLMAFYRRMPDIGGKILEEALLFHLHLSLQGINPYAAFADTTLLGRFESLGTKGLTVTAPGFYGPQARQLRTAIEAPELITLLHSFRHHQYRICNMEMETAGIYALGGLLGHRCIAISAILAHRIDNTFSKSPQQTIDRMIAKALEVIRG